MNPQNKKYDTLEELREAQREASKRYYERNKSNQSNKEAIHYGKQIFQYNSCT